MLKSWAYNRVFKPITLRLYQEVLSRFPANARILEIGIGNGEMLKSFQDKVKEKNLKVLGVDPNLAYLKNCRKLVRQYQLAHNIQLVEGYAEDFFAKFPSVIQKANGSLWNNQVTILSLDQVTPTQHPPLSEVREEDKFDYIFFSQSFPLIRDGLLVLREMHPWLKKGGKVIFVQTFFQKTSKMLDLVKPNIKFFTTVDFGKMTYEDVFFGNLNKYGWQVLEEKDLEYYKFGGALKLIMADEQPNLKHTN